MANKNYQITKFYASLFEIKEAINNEIIPAGVHIGAQTTDQKLFESLEILSTDIEEHLNRYQIELVEKS